jgi:hypothetical protein
MVMSVDPQGPGAASGVHQADIIVTWNSEPIRHVQSRRNRTAERVNQSQAGTLGGNFLRGPIWRPRRELPMWWAKMGMAGALIPLLPKAIIASIVAGTSDARHTRATAEAHKGAGALVEAVV